MIYPSEFTLTRTDTGMSNYPSRDFTYNFFVATPVIKFKTENTK